MLPAPRHAEQLKVVVSIYLSATACSSVGSEPWLEGMQRPMTEVAPVLALQGSDAGRRRRRSSSSSSGGGGRRVSITRGSDDGSSDGSGGNGDHDGDAPQGSKHSTSSGANISTGASRAGH